MRQKKNPATPSSFQPKTDTGVLESEDQESVSEVPSISNSFSEAVGQQKPVRKIDQTILNKAVRAHVSDSRFAGNESMVNKFFDTLQEHGGYSDDQIEKAKIANQDLNQVRIPVKTKVQTAEELAKKKEKETSYFGGALNAFNEGFNNYVLTPLDGAAKLVSDLTGLEHSGSFKKAAEAISESTQEHNVFGTPNMPNTIGGDILGGVAGTIPMIATLALTPEFKIAQGLAVPKMSSQMAATGFLNKYGETGSALESTKEALHGGVEGAILHGLGLSASGIGDMVKEMGAGKITSKATAALANGILFGGYEGGVEYAETGSIDTRKVLASIGMGMALSLPELTSAITEKVKGRALANYFSASNETINKINETGQTVEELRKKAQDVGEKVVEPNAEGDVKGEDKNQALVMTQQALSNMADVKAVNDAVTENPDLFIKVINEDADLSPEQKKEYIDKITYTVGNAAINHQSESSVIKEAENKQNIETSNPEFKSVNIAEINDENAVSPNQRITAYHATKTGEIKIGGNEAGIHVGTEVAANQIKDGRNGGVGEVKKVEVDIKNPILLDDMDSFSSVNLLSQLSRKGIIDMETYKEIRDSQLSEQEKQQKIIDILRDQKKYDGIVYKNKSEDPGKYSAVVFDGSKIKEVIEDSAPKESTIPSPIEPPTETSETFEKKIHSGDLAREIIEGKTTVDEAMKKAESLGVKVDETLLEILKEKVAKPEGETGISKELRDEQRTDLGLDDLPKVDMNKSEHTHEYLINEANRLVDSGEMDFRKLAEDVTNKGLDTNDLDKAVLLRGATEVGKEIISAEDALDKAKSLGDKVAEDLAQDNYLKSLNDLNNIHKALKSEGTKAGRNLAAFQMTMKQDYSIGNLYTRFRKVSGDKPLPKEIIERLDTYAVQIKELDTLIKEQEAQLKKQGSDIEDLKSKSPITKDKIKEVREKRTKLFDEWKEFRSSTEGPTKQGLGIGDKDILFLGKIALSYLEEGYLTTLQVSAQLKKDVKEQLGIKLSDKDINNILNGEVEGKKVMDSFDHSDLQKKIDENKLKRAKIKQKINNEEGAIEYANKTTSQKVKEGVSNVLNVPRSLMASFDFSAPLRQGLVASVSHPVSATKAFSEMFKQAFSQKNFDNWLLKYKDSPEYKLAEQSDLYIADPSNLHLNGREEAFMSNLAERIPLVGKAIKGSERAYVGYLNKLRTDVFKNGVEQLQKQGKSFESHPEDFKALADFINNSTGRGKLPNKTIEDAAPLLNSIFFSPRLIASRINLLNPVYFAKMPPQVRAMALTDMAKFVGFSVTALTLASLGGADVEADPRSSDFGKIKIGDTRYDMLGGFQQYIRLGSQLITGQKKSTNTGLIQDLSPNKFPYTSRGGQLGSFVRNKLSPATGMGMDFLTGKDAVGLPTTFKNEMYTHFTPLQLQDALKSYEIGGAKKVVQTMIPSMFGVGVQTYSSRETEKKLKIQDEIDSESDPKKKKKLQDSLKRLLNKKPKKLTMKINNP